MNIEKIRANAPEGATHYDEFGNYYLSIKSGAANICYQLRDGEWQTPYSMFLNLKPL